MITHVAIKATPPCNSSAERGYVEIISMAAPPWETPRTRAEAIEEAHAAGGIVKGNSK